jgi:hypothetical protein
LGKVEQKDGPVPPLQILKSSATHEPRLSEYRPRGSRESFFIAPHEASKSPTARPNSNAAIASSASISERCSKITRPGINLAPSSDFSGSSTTFPSNRFPVDHSNPTSSASKIATSPSSTSGPDRLWPRPHAPRPPQAAGPAACTGQLPPSANTSQPTASWSRCASTTTSRPAGRYPSSPAPPRRDRGAVQRPRTTSGPSRPPCRHGVDRCRLVPLPPPHRQRPGAPPPNRRNLELSRTRPGRWRAYGRRGNPKRARHGLIGCLFLGPPSKKGEFKRSAPR